MALADTAKLLASLELQDKFSPTAKKVEASLGRMEGRFGRIGGIASKGLGTAARRLATIGTAAAAAGTVAIAAGVKAGINSLAELESATTSVQGAIEQMGLAGQISAGQVAGWANEIESNVEAAFDDKAITSATANLIRYGKVTPETLRPAMEVMTDLAARTGDVSSAGEILGKALADPTKAAGKLSRYGIILTETQQDQIKAMTEAGDAAGAQAKLLDILAASTKGAAKASAGPYRDAMNLLDDAIEDAQRALAEGFLPVIQEVADWLSRELVKPATIQSIRDFGKGLAGAFREALKWAKSLDWDGIAGGIKSAAGFAKTLIDAFMAMPTEVKALIVGLAGLDKLSGGAVSGIIGELGKGLIKGVLGMNAGVVNLNAGVVRGTGIGGGGGAAPTGGATSKLGKVAGVAKVFVAGMAVAAAGVLAEQLMAQSAQIREMGEGVKESAREWVSSDATTRQQIVDAINRIDEQMSDPFNALALEVTNGLNGGKDALLATRAELSNKLAILDGRGTALHRTFGQVGGAIEQRINSSNFLLRLVQAGGINIVTGLGATKTTLNTALGTVRAAVNTTTGVLRAKNFAPRIVVPVTVNNAVSVRALGNSTKVIRTYSTAVPT